MKAKMIKNETIRNAVISINNENNKSNFTLNQNYMCQLSELKIKNQNDLNRLGTNLLKNQMETNFQENNFFKCLIDNFFEYLSDQNSNEQKHLNNKLDTYPMLQENQSNQIESLNLNNSDQKVYKNFIYHDGKKIPNLNDSCILKPYSENLIQLNNSSANIFKVENDNIKKTTYNFNNANDFVSQNNNDIIKNVIPENVENIFNFNTINSNDQKLSEKEKLSNLSENILKNLNNVMGFNQSTENMKDTNIGLNEDEKSPFILSCRSFNNFEDCNFAQNSNIFNSPNPSEGIMYKISNEINDKININFDLSRNSSFDYNEIFKSGPQEIIQEKKLSKENNLFYDDTFFSLNSNEKKDEVIFDNNQNNAMISGNLIY